MKQGLFLSERRESIGAGADLAGAFVPADIIAHFASDVPFHADLFRVYDPRAARARCMAWFFYGVYADIALQPAQSGRLRPCSRRSGYTDSEQIN